MSNVYLATVKNKELVFSSPEHGDFFWKDMEGKNIRITLENIEKEEISLTKHQRFFSGAVAKYFFYQHEKGVFQNFAEAREALKLYGNPIRAYDLKTKKWIISAGTTTGKTVKWWDEKFLPRLEYIFNQSGYLYPDSTEYNDWAKRGPAKNEIFPPLLMLIEQYNKK